MLQDAYKAGDESTINGVKGGIEKLREAIHHDVEHGMAHGQLALSLMNSVRPRPELSRSAEPWLRIGVVAGRRDT